LRGWLTSRRQAGRLQAVTRPLGPLGSSSSQHRWTPELVLQKSHASFRITCICVTGSVTGSDACVPLPEPPEQESPSCRLEGCVVGPTLAGRRGACGSSATRETFLLLSGLELGDSEVYQPCIRARIGDRHTHAGVKHTHARVGETGVYCRTTSASTAPRTPRRTCCP